MAEILIKAQDATHWNSVKDVRGCYKRGHPVVVMPDNHPWGIEERWPKFAYLKIPGISVERVMRYVQPSVDGQGEIIGRRLWRIRWEDLPQAARNKFRDNGQLIIKAGTYDGPFDYTWTQIKTFFRNAVTGLNETEDV